MKNIAGNFVNVSNIENKITAGNGGNTFQSSNSYSNTTITAGIGEDTYYLNEGRTKITDKGGNNNAIYGGEGNDIYSIYLTVTLNLFYCHPELVSGSYKFQFLFLIGQMLKLVQHDCTIISFQPDYLIKYNPSNSKKSSCYTLYTK